MSQRMTIRRLPIICHIMASLDQKRPQREKLRVVLNATNPTHTIVERWRKEFILAAPVLREYFYMDNVLCGAASLMEAKAFKNQISGIWKRGGMELRKWGSSHPELASNIIDYEFENPNETKTLGVSWKTQYDCFFFKIAVELKDSYTKICILSTIARLFDTLGLLSPEVARANILMQPLES
ncbi:uncharacterized protein TNCV_4511271 [Trichonephila clavipes]|nr:uncharacterized protein TNCV_4511271 [Trichonephila clavipes]